MSRRIEEIRARLSAATTGPVRYDEVYIDHDDIGDFIANAPDDIRYLLARVAELERLAREARTELHRSTEHPDYRMAGALDRLDEALRGEEGS